MVFMVRTQLALKIVFIVAYIFCSVLSIKHHALS